jgi:hypothetical protein
MKNNVKITKEQIKTMHDYISGYAFYDKRQKKDLKLLYSLLTPKDIYVKYTSYALEPDNGISSEVNIKCIKPDGSRMNCVEQFDNLKQRLEFESNLIEIDLDANGKIVLV